MKLLFDATVSIRLLCSTFHLPLRPTHFILRQLHFSPFKVPTIFTSL